MPYTNIQHSSNTRTTVTTVLSIIFGISIIPTTVLGSGAEKKSLVFTLENANYPTLLQEVKVKIQRDTTTVTGAANGFTATDTFGATDEVYFIKEAEGCKTPPKGVTPRRVTVADDKSYADATVIIKSPEFALMHTHKMCYIKKSTGSDGTTISTVYVALYLKGSEQNYGTFTVFASIFKSHKMEPAIVYPGQEGVKLSIYLEGGTGGLLDGEGNKRLYLVPCAGDKCMKDNIAQVCRDTGNGAVATGVVTTIDTKYATFTLETTFTAPANPAISYRICVPYCFQAGSCTIGTVYWALVNSEPIMFKPSNPSYTLLPKSPEGRTWTKITFTGTGLSDKDKIRIVAQGKECSSTAELLPNIEYTEVAPPSGSKSSGTSSVFKFRLNDALRGKAAVIGKVCYARKDNETWTPVYKTPGQTNGDLVISPLQPTGFTVVPRIPQVGQVLKVTFTGNELHPKDTSYLVKCPISEISDSSSSDFCDDIASTTTKIKYECKITENGDEFANCNANINPDISNGEGMQVCACYKKNGHTDYALVAGSVTVYPKSPTYTITPYPFTVGQEAKLKFTGTDLKDTDAVKIISEGGDCNTEGTLTTGTITATKDGNVKGAAEVTYTIMGTKSGCFTVCYRRKTIWTVSTNSDSSAVIPTSSCTSPLSLFLSPKTSPPPVVLPPAPTGQHDTSTDGKGTGKNTGGVRPKVSATVPPMPDGKNATTLSATAISSTIPAVLITSVVFLYLYNW